MHWDARCETSGGWWIWFHQLRFKIQRWIAKVLVETKGLNTSLVYGDFALAY